MTDRLKTIAALSAAFGLGFGAGALCVAFALVLGAGGLGGAPPVAEHLAAPASYADAVARAAPSVVRVFGQRLGPAATPLPQPGATPGLSRGSAVVVSDDGLLVTNGHIVIGADAIGVEAPGHGIQAAELLGVDAATDLAVLRITEPVGPAIAVGEPERLRPGDVVLAIGNPFGLDQTVSQGIVSATGRDDLGLTEIEDFIQTDAPVNPGNSGGALIDTRGLLVGINTAIMSDSGRSEGVAFAIPSDRAMEVVREIAAHGNVTRGWIGIGARTLDATLAQRFGLRTREGVLVTRVLEESPAATADLRAGDVIVKIGDEAVPSSPALRKRISAAGDGTELAIELMRGSERLTTRITTGLRPAPSVTAPSPAAVAARPGCTGPDGDGC
ncbi:S1C family serine protease [Thiohalocapsa sp. ML1]|uniref:S1C family serine protease n=1 Tax=Thiohalocapsa sp. ML1 TaxID=1431688 RepID=UPI000732162A|nr:trypsin-like peptidase domain-containing protein [Thiohalocapsa sp. ML1]